MRLDGAGIRIKFGDARKTKRNQQIKKTPKDFRQTVLLLRQKL
jgi:hypothetical protein